MNLADIVGILIVLLFIIWGTRKGFMQAVFSLSSFVIALILAFLLSSPVSGLLEKSFIGDYVHKSTYEMLVNEDVTETKTEEVASSLPLPKMMTKAITDEAEETALSVQKQLADSVATVTLNVLSAIIVFILVKLLVFLLSHLLDLISRLPVLRSANKLLGGMLGAVYGILVIYMILTLFTLGATATPLQTALELVLDSRVISVMYHQNILLNFLQ